MKLILGHNQFIGISHISEDKSIDKDRFFSNVQNIYNVAETASELGYRDMVIETHPRMLEFLRYYSRNKTFEMNFFLQVPYVQGYIQRMNENGLRSLVTELVGRVGLASAAGIAFKGSLSLLRRNYNSIALSALKFEIAPFAGFDVRALLLHNVVTDLLLALGAFPILQEYVEFVREKLDLEPGFVTSNFPLARMKFEEMGVRPLWVMTPVNQAGFEMNPSKVLVEKALIDCPWKVIAMNVLGGGAFSANEAAQYLKSLDAIEYVVVGASSPEHLKELYEAF